jgi:hypothetical protein
LESLGSVVGNVTEVKETVTATGVASKQLTWIDKLEDVYNRSAHRNMSTTKA